MHKQMLPFLEMKIGIDATAFECESIVSETNVQNVTYNYGLDKVNEFLRSKEVEKMISENFPKEEKLKVDLETENQLNSFLKKLHSESKEENIPNLEKISCESEDNISEISELEDVDCSAFVGTSSNQEETEVGNSYENDLDANVCNNNFNTCSDNNAGEHNFDANMKTACESNVGVDENKTACEPNMNNENNPACETSENAKEKVFPSFQNEKVSREVVKIKDITYKTLKKEGQLRGHKIKKPSSDSSSDSNSSDDSNNSNVKAILFPKLKNIPNSLFVKSGCSKASTSKLSSIVMKENSDCSSDANYSSDGYNNTDDWKASFRYVSGNLNKNNKSDNLELTHKQRQNQDYKRKMRTKRKSVRQQESLDQSNSNFCQCQCRNQNNFDKHVISNLSEKALRKHNKSFATKRLSQKETKRVFRKKFLKPNLFRNKK